MLLTAGADVALVAVEEAVSDPHVCARGRVAQLSLTHPTLQREREAEEAILIHIPVINNKLRESLSLSVCVSPTLKQWMWK